MIDLGVCIPLIGEVTVDRVKRYTTRYQRLMCMTLVVICFVAFSGCSTVGAAGRGVVRGVGGVVGGAVKTTGSVVKGVSSGVKRALP